MSGSKKELPLAPLETIMKESLKNDDTKISKSAVIHLRLIITDLIEKISRKAERKAKSEERIVVKDRDIQYVYEDMND